eukprot:scaffold20444_cov71-Phaeocystis_antarctica.AAC.4
MWYRGPLNGTASPPNGIRWPSVGLRAVRPHRALFLRASQHHSSFASSSDHALLTMLHAGSSVTVRLYLNGYSP